MSRTGHRVLVVEDDEALMMGIVENLRFDGHEVISAASGDEALRVARKEHPNLVILDLMLPGVSGYAVCRELRAEGFQAPIMMVTARTDEFDKLHGFEVGADDYVTKPFSIKELLARVRVALLRGPRPASGVTRYAFGECELDLVSRTLRRKGRDISLTRTEFDLMAYFCCNEGKALSRDRLMTDVWGTNYYGTQRSLDSFVSVLRSKIEKNPSQPRHIVTLHGVGYKFHKSV